MLFRLDGLPGHESVSDRSCRTTGDAEGAVLIKRRGDASDREYRRGGRSFERGVEEPRIVVATVVRCKQPTSVIATDLRRNSVADSNLREPLETCSIEWSRKKAIGGCGSIHFRHFRRRRREPIRTGPCVGCPHSHRLTKRRPASVAGAEVLATLILKNRIDGECAS